MEDKYLSGGVEDLKPWYHRMDSELRAQEKENERLKRIIAKQALEIEIKSKTLKNLSKAA